MWEDFRFQINKHKNLVAKHEIIPYPRFTKLIIRHILSQNQKLNKLLDSTPHLIADEAQLEKLKYAPKGERKPAFGMPIPEAIMSGGIKETQVYADYVTKYPQAQTASKHGMGKSLMKRGAIPTPKKKKDAAPKRSRSITVEDKYCQTLTKLASMLKRQVNNEGYKHLKVKLKTKQQPSPEAMLLLNLKKQGKESKKQAILEEIKRKDTGEGSGAAPESPYHSSSSNGFFKSATNHDKIENERESDHDKSDNDYEHGDESDKSASDEVSTEYVESDNDFDNANDQTEQLVIKPLNKEPEQPPKSLPTPSPSITATSAKDYTRYLNDPKDVQINQLPKLLPKAVFDALKKTMVNLSQPTPIPSVDPSEYKLKYHLYEKMLQTATYLKHPKHRALDQEEPTHFERGNDVDEPRQDDEQLHEGHKFQAKEIPEEPEEHEYKDVSVTLFEKLVKKIFKKYKIQKKM
nr:hypothetical protein [Tanacetum cinerariifolium]